MLAHLKSHKIESFSKKYVKEKSERGELIYSSGRLLPRQWDHQYEMARTICWSAPSRNPNYFVEKSGRTVTEKKSSVLVDTTSLNFLLKEKLPVDVNGKTFHWLHSGWPLWVHFQEETSQRVAICLCRILPPLPTRPPDLPTFQK